MAARKSYLRFVRPLAAPPSPRHRRRYIEEDRPEMAGTRRSAVPRHVLESFRAPDVIDLFLGGAESFPAAVDSCNTLNIGLATTDAARAAPPTAFRSPACSSPTDRSARQAATSWKPNTATKKRRRGLQPELGSGLNITLDCANITLAS